MSAAVRCTASGQVRTWVDGAWSSSDVFCPDCGARGDLVWVCGTDLTPRAKTRAHRAPPGVEPAPYAAHPNGGVQADPRPRPTPVRRWTGTRP